MTNKRIRKKELLDKCMSATEAAKLIGKKETIATSGFTPSGYPKAVPLALAELQKEAGDYEITLLCGASVGQELDGELAATGALKRRYPYQTNNVLRKGINDGSIEYLDMHLSHVPQNMLYGFFGDIDTAIVEATAITEEGYIIPTTSVGLAPTALKLAKKVIVELNSRAPEALEGIHDIYIPEAPPHRKAIPLEKVDDRIGTPYMEVDPEKIVAIVETDMTDDVRPLAPIDDDAKKISEHIIRFLEKEVEEGRLPENLLPLQSGVGSVANAVLAGLENSNFKDLTCFTEVIQDSMLDLLDSGKVRFASGTSFSPSKAGLQRLLDNIEFYAERTILRPMEISNHPELVRRLGIISINTAIEFDIYGHVNSTNIMGSRMMNGVGGSGDYTRNAYISIFTTNSVAMEGAISSVVPMVSHVDHTEQDVQVVVTEQGYADLRGKSPRERARLIIDNCAHPDYKAALEEYYEDALKGKYIHEPHNLKESLSWHVRFNETGTMRK